ncbi:methylated-DNA--[protein]-cysteine S-methyltransferase [Ornithinicoccus halotolerans]|uniref:methylated-DNA--[protein]-cysteine S-methyltransferase n=1 Tax=Ornithinicoccus halotolerans TaxID=1748220 RepID=UPI0012971469|nr:methylated-DNA--[protein]-cysteine S-methyltransferase [Ornithinicoccus halotolerans]
MKAHAVLPSPLGELTVVTDGEAVTGLYMTAHRHAPDHQSHGPRVEPDEGPAVLARTAAELAAYFAGELCEFTVPVATRGTSFQERVWRGLRDIPYGRTWSYAQLADHIGASGAARAVGLANGRNPVSVIVPCHRVIGANGSLTGYGGGMERKRTLLALESRAPASAAGRGAQHLLF